MTENKRTVWQTLYQGLINRCFFVYVVLGFLVYTSINQDALITTHINLLMQSEVDVKAFAAGGQNLDPQSLRMALRYYKELSHYVPKDGVVQGNMGFCYFHLKDYRRSLEAYRKGIALEPHVWVMQWDLAMILLQEGKTQEAIATWEAYLLNQPAMKEYFKALKEKLLGKQRLDAFYLVRRMEERFAEDEVETYIKLSESYFLLKKYDLSRITAVAGLKLSPNNRNLAYIAGLAVFFEEKLPEAASYFTKTLAINPMDINAYYYRSLCMKYLGDKKQEALDIATISQLRARGAEALPFPSRSRLHFNTEMLSLRYHLQDTKKE